MLKQLSVAFAVCMLISCGYQLKQSPNVGNVHLNAQSDNAFARAFKRTLNQQAAARYRVEIGDEIARERLITYDTSGRARDVNLQLSVSVKVYDLADQPLFTDKLLQSRMITLSGDAQTDNTQKTQVYEDLRSALVYMLSIRLNNIDERQK